MDDVEDEITTKDNPGEFSIFRILVTPSHLRLLTSCRVSSNRAQKGLVLMLGIDRCCPRPDSEFHPVQISQDWRKSPSESVCQAKFQLILIRYGLANHQILQRKRKGTNMILRADIPSVIKPPFFPSRGHFIRPATALPA